jgi:predicted DNA-binding protein
MSKTTLYLPVDLQQALRVEARRTGASQAELVRQALEAFFRGRERRSR